MKCEYCLRENNSEVEFCLSCGAPLKRYVKDVQEFWKSDPFFFDGYMVYITRDIQNDKVGCLFWLGEKLVDRFEVPSALLEQFVKPYEDCMPFFYNLLKVSQGEQEVYRIKAMNKGRPTTFEIRKIISEDELRYTSMEYSQIARGFRR